MQPRRSFLKSTLLGLSTLAFCQGNNSTRATRKPNFIIIFCDDLGYGDLGCFGHPTIKTPHLDRMACEGQKWTNFYAADSVCTPSRAGLLTGRLPVRCGMADDKRRVLFPDSAGGLPADEITIAEALKKCGYATACIGKWHLGHLPQYLPTNNGFDYYFGIPYSNDMNKVAPKEVNVFKNSKIEFFNVPLMRNTEIIERPADQRTITQRYIQESVQYIKSNKNQPFFLYLAHNMPHVPLFRSDAFSDKSLRGLYGDVVEEIDWGVGQIMQTVQECGLEQDTLVLFTSDNGPWLIFNEQGGDAGLLRDGKGSTFEGGMREPAIFWWPGKIKTGVVAGMGSTLDVLPTFCKLAGAEPIEDRPLDGFDLSDVLFKQEASPRRIMYYYRGRKLFALRKGAFKAHFITQAAYGDPKITLHEPPLLFNVDIDPGERVNIAAAHADVIADLRMEAERHLAAVVPGENQMIKVIRK